jgi:hypothetical protein
MLGLRADSERAPPRPFNAVPHIPYADHAAHCDQLVVPSASLGVSLSVPDVSAR